MRHNAIKTLEPLEDRRLFASYAAANVAELIGAINAANASAEPDTIALEAGATLALTAVNNTVDGPSGLPVITAGGGGLTVIGNGSTIERSSATGTPSFRLFNVAPDASLTLNNLTVRGGKTWAAGWYLEPAQGGGIYNRGSLSLAGVTVEDNTTVGWMPVYNSAAVPAGSAEGGGIYSAGTLTITGSVIQNNIVVGGQGSDSYIMHGYFNYRAVPGADGFGGGIYIAGGAASISNSMIRSNWAHGGYGGRLGGSTLRGGDGYGGGLYAAAGALTILNSSITANTAKGGGGLVWKHGAFVPGNEGTGTGGGIYVNSAASAELDVFTIRNTTGNAAPNSRDIFGRYRRIR